MALWGGEGRREEGGGCKGERAETWEMTWHADRSQILQKKMTEKDRRLESGQKIEEKRTLSW